MGGLWGHSPPKPQMQKTRKGTQMVTFFSSVGQTDSGKVRKRRHSGTPLLCKTGRLLLPPSQVS